MGTFNGHHYYLSDEQVRWTQAQAQATANGGHLVVINDAAENDFIKNGIGANIIHIGLEFDPATNTSAWVNGDNLDYDNMEATVNSSTINRFGLMNFWNGQWNFHGDYTKAYVMEIPCSGNDSNNGGNGIDIQQIAGLENGADFPVGLTFISYLAMDACGGEAICTFNVIVERGTSALTLACPPDLNVTTSSGAATAIANWDLPTITSDCDGTPSLTLQSDMVSYEATDNCGNTETCSFQVNVTSGGSNLNLTCPANISLTTAAGVTTAPASWQTPLGISDCVLGEPTVTINTPLVSGDLFPAGTTTVTYEAVDACAAAVTWQTPVATSDCTVGAATVSLVSPLASGDNFPIGTSTVIYEAVDACGSTSNCTFQVTVLSGSSNLSLTCPADIAISTAAGATSAIATWQDPIDNTDCSLGSAVVDLISPLASGAAFPIGTSTLTYEAIDPCGSITSCSFQVIVTELAGGDLSLNCPQNIRLKLEIQEVALAAHRLLLQVLKLLEILKEVCIISLLILYPGHKLKQLVRMLAEIWYL